MADGYARRDYLLGAQPLGYSRCPVGSVRHLTSEAQRRFYGDGRLRQNSAHQRRVHEGRSRELCRAALVTKLSEDLALMADHAPRIMRFAVDLHKHLADIPFPTRKGALLIHILLAYFSAC